LAARGAKVGVEQCPCADHPLGAHVTMLGMQMLTGETRDDHSRRSVESTLVDGWRSRQSHPEAGE